MPQWVMYLMIAPWFILMAFWARLTFRNMRLIRKLKSEGAIASFNTFAYWSGEYDHLSEELKEVRARATRYMLLFGLAMLWFIGVWLVTFILLK